MAERRASRIVGTVVVIAIAAICVRLGFWQLSRLNEKKVRNAAVATRSAEPAVQLTSATTDSAELTWRRASARGHYDDERSIILPGRSYGGSPGVLLLTPLRLEGARAVLVQRGWVPSLDAATIDLGAFRTDTMVSVDGLLLPFLNDENTIATGATMEPADSFRHVWYTIDADRLRAQFPYPLLPFRLQRLPAEQTDSDAVDARRTPGTRGISYPLAQPAPVLDEGPHLGYAVQWFSFALIFVVGWIALLRSRRRRA